MHSERCKSGSARGHAKLSIRGGPIRLNTKLGLISGTLPVRHRCRVVHGGGRALLATNARPTRWATRVHCSCCLLDRRQRREVELVGRLLVQRRMWPRGVVEADVSSNAELGLSDRVVCMQVGEWRGGVAPPRSPRTGREPLDSSGSYRPVVMIAALRELAGERLARELAALVGVEDLGLAVPREGLLQGLDAERDVHADRHPMCQHLAACPVDCWRTGRPSRKPSGCTVE